MEDLVIKIRGLPYGATAVDIAKFFNGIKIKNGMKGIHIPPETKQQRWGEAFIEFYERESMDKAMAKHMEHIDNRYIEIFPSNLKIMKRVCFPSPDRIVEGGGVGGVARSDHHRRNRSRSPLAPHQHGGGGGSSSGRTSPSASRRDYTVRIKGLPFDATKEDLTRFFDGLEIARNGMSILVDKSGKALGDAFVQFASGKDMRLAKERHGKKIGHRYIEIYDSSLLEANNQIHSQIQANEEKPSSSYYDYEQNSSRGVGDLGSVNAGLSSIRISGLPGGALADDIVHFLSPLRPRNIQFFESGGMTGGGARGAAGWGEQAMVDFVQLEEALDACKKDRQRLGNHSLRVDLTMKKGVPVGAGGGGPIMPGRGGGIPPGVAGGASQRDSSYFGSSHHHAGAAGSSGAPPSNEFDYSNGSAVKKDRRSYY